VERSIISEVLTKFDHSGREWKRNSCFHNIYLLSQFLQANVVCKQLGYEKAATIVDDTKFEQATGLSTKVSCLGTEKSISECKIESIGSCGSSQGAAVVCENEIQQKGDFYVMVFLMQIRDSAVFV
jgi:hypothetical protein